MNAATNTSRQLDGFEETVKDFWASRPRRPHQGRKVAGVAAGIGNRYGIDPVVVRVALVATTVFGGIGLTAYLLGWLFLPAEGDEVSAFESLIGRGRSSVSKPFAALLCLLLFPVSGWAFAGDWFDGGGFIGMALLVTALYLLHRSRGQFNRPAPPTVGVTLDYAAAATAATAAGGSAAGAQHGTWDPLGAAPLAWELPEPAPPPQPPPPRPRRPRSKIAFATFGVAIAVAGVGSALVAEGVPWFTLAHVIGLVLGVIGVGLVLSAFRGGGRWLTGLAVPLAVAGLVLTSLPLNDFRGGVGELDATPRTAAEVLPVYERTAGEIRLDLRQLRATTPVETAVRNGAGNVTVIVPTTADVTYQCEAGVGNIECLGRQQSGAGTAPISGVDLGDDGEGGQRLSLKVVAGAGNVEVRRG
ncbi:phage shock protein PspC (stress-responsive transcriptional regulator) [Saccharomonospora amisosensis]|uniref:Phage shock protein PspC (Stress-responsive transcriptional regulator) n=1 Tax=Saccharomonospora amisosensis TaxID=1128677 RepID=A0A7X5ZT10_9PSEU|nr:PspC domain-containing protein [Saccharomonospora amisosensis]NIJ14141.1 phage shock protein PspC (stress-responsive transcriptional regulator) [Saccharomonospora amisosensis]